jgi:DNA-binding SARP family transcriptional activator
MRSLIAYLALYRKKEIPRQRLAFLFWPDSNDKQAQTNLRQLLFHLKTIFPAIENYLSIGSKALHWKEKAPVYFDINEFQYELENARIAREMGDYAKERKYLEDAENLFHENLFPGCYDDWIEQERDKFRNQGIGMLSRLCDLCEIQGDYSAGLEYGKKLRELDEYNEEIYQRLMRLYALNRDRNGALRIYHQCEKILAEELGLEPSLETQEMAQRLKENENIRKVVPTLTPEIPLVGREEERKQMFRVWEKVKMGNARILFVYGEMGIGKTRLVEEMIQYLSRQGFVTATSRCYPTEGDLPYSPISDLLKNNTIYPILSGLKDIWQIEIARLLPELLEEHTNLSLPDPLSENWQKHRFFKALVKIFLTVSQPILLFIDDLHWADPETIEWLHYLLRFRPHARILIVTTARTEELTMNRELLSFLLELRRNDHLVEIELGSMSPEQTATLAQSVAGCEIPESALSILFTKTEGNPLFIVEMTRAVMEVMQQNGMDIRQGFSINPLPQKIQAVILARLSYLSAKARNILDIAAIIGRKFSFKVLQYVMEDNAKDLAENLEELLRHLLVREQEDMTYNFLHEKIYEVVLSQISETRKCILHQQVAQTLATFQNFPDERSSGNIANHWEHAGDWGKAIEYYIRAGNASRRLFANEEAAEYFQKAMHLVNLHVTNIERDQLELSILKQLSNCLVQCRGYGTSAVQNVGSRILQLSEKLEETPDSPLWRMLAIGKLVIGEFQQAERFGLMLLKQGKQNENLVAEIEAHYVLGVTYHWQGNFKKAESHLKKALFLYRPDRRNAHLTEYAQDPAVICRIRLAMVLWHLGKPVQSEILAREALDRSEILEHPFTRSYALHWYAWLQNLKEDVTATLEFAKISVEFSEKYHFPYFATQSNILYGWALFQQGEKEEGIQIMREELGRFRSTGTEVGCPYYRALIAEALSNTETVSQSVALLKEALQSGEKAKEGWSAAAMLKMKARIYRKRNDKDTDQILKLYYQAIQTARKFGDKMTAFMVAKEINRFIRQEKLQVKPEPLVEEAYTWVMKNIQSREKQWLKNFFLR